MVDPLRESRDKADRPESRAPYGLARKVPICVVALLGIVGPTTTGQSPLRLNLARQVIEGRAPLGWAGYGSGAPRLKTKRAGLADPFAFLFSMNVTAAWTSGDVPPHLSGLGRPSSWRRFRVQEPVLD